MKNNIEKSVQCIKCRNKYTTRALLIKHLRWHKRMFVKLLLTNSSTLEGEQSEHLSPNKENKNNE